MTDRAHPIIIGGIGRSGSTFLQWALSQHPEIHIYGQVNTFDFGKVHDACLLTERAVAENREGNKRGKYPTYPFAHYAGSDPATVRNGFAEAMRLSICGPEPCPRRWGFKYIHTVRSPFDHLWPGAQWIICVRNPFTTFESCINAGFTPRQTVPEDWLAKWMRVPHFLKEHPSTPVWQADKLAEASPNRRRAEARRLCEYLGEEPHKAVLDYVERYEVVHKWVPDSERSFELTRTERKRCLEGVPGLWGALVKLGYQDTAP